METIAEPVRCGSTAKGAVHTEALAVTPEPALAVQAGRGLHRIASAVATAAADPIAVVAPEPAELAQYLSAKAIDWRVATDPTTADDL